MLRTMLLAPAAAFFFCLSTEALAESKAAPAGARTAASKAPPDAKLRRQASAFFEDGKTALAAKDAARCEEKFLAAYDTIPKPVVLLKVADCRKLTGVPGPIVRILERYLAEAPDATDRVEVEAQIAALKTAPGKVSVTSNPPGATIWMDGTNTGERTPAMVEVAPGEHTIALKLSTYQTEEQVVVVPFGAQKDMELQLTPEPRRPAVELNVPVEQEPAQGGSYHPSPVFWIAAGGAVAAGGVAAVFGVMATKAHSKFEDTPTRELYDDGRRDALVSDIALGVAVVSGITAGVLFFGSKSADKPAASAILVIPSFSQGGGGLVGHVRF